MSQYALVTIFFGSAVFAISFFEGPKPLSPMFAFVLLSLGLAAFFLRVFELSVLVIIGLLGSLIDYYSFYPRNVPMNLAFWATLAVGTFAGRLIFRKFLGERIGHADLESVTRESWR